MSDQESGDGNGVEDGAAPGEDVGSVADEASRLFDALSDWARDGRGGVGEGLSGLAAQAAASARDVSEHLATGSAECSYCPICRTVHAVRQTSPEVRAHLATAAASLMQAAAGMLATAVPDDARARGGEGVEHIDLDEGDWPEEDE